jgi:hypothetical protein
MTTATDFGTATYNGKIYTLVNEATLSNRVFTGWWGDAEEGEPYTAEYNADAVDADGNQYMIYWQFDEIKGNEPEDESNYPFDDAHVTRVDQQ